MSGRSAWPEKWQMQPKKSFSPEQKTGNRVHKLEQNAGGWSLFYDSLL